MSSLKNFLFKNYFVIFLTFLSIFIFTINLSGQAYSFDEPETVILAHAISTTGFPSAWDGKNLIWSSEDFNTKLFLGRYVWTWHGWLEYYLTFFGLKLFGDNVFGARFLFALIGTLTIPLIYVIAKIIFKNKTISFLLSLQLLFLLPFFLYTRHARYYILETFFSFVIFFFFLMRENKHWNRIYSILFPLTLLFLFFSNNYMWFTTNIIIFPVLIYKKDKQLILSTFLVVAFAVFWQIVFRNQSGHVLHFFPGATGIPKSLFVSLSYINNNAFPLILSIPLLILLIKKKTSTILLFILFWIVIKLLLNSIFVAAHGRYILELFPFFILLFGFIYEYLLRKKHFILVFILFFTATFTNILNNIPRALTFQKTLPPKNIVKSYSTELSGKYPSSMQQLGGYLKKNYKKGDLWASNGYQDQIYLYSSVPSISSHCVNGKLLAPSKSVTDIKKIRWIILFQGDDRISKTKVINDFCMGKSWQKNLKLFKKTNFKLNSPTYTVNDPDIAVRQYPPVEAAPSSIIILERKE